MYYKIHMSFHQVISDLSILLQDIFHKTKTAKWKLRLYWNILITFWGAKTVPKDSPLFTEFSRQEHWSGLPFPPPGDFHDLGIKPTFLAPPALAGGFFTTVPPGKPQQCVLKTIWSTKLGHSESCFMDIFKVPQIVRCFIRNLFS